MTRKEKEIEAIKCLAVQLHSLGWSPGKTIDQVLDWCRSFVTVEMFDGEISNVVFDQWLDCEVMLHPFSVCRDRPSHRPEVDGT